MVTKLSSMNTLTGPARSSYSLVFLIRPSMNADVVLRGTHTYLSAAENPSTAIDTLCATPSLGSDTLPSTRYASDSGFLSSTAPSGSSNSTSISSCEVPSTTSSNSSSKAGGGPAGAVTLMAMRAAG